MHLLWLMDFIEDYWFCQDDAIVRLFFILLKEDAREWLSNLFPFSISSWEDFQLTFDERFGEIIPENVV